MGQDDLSGLATVRVMRPHLLLVDDEPLVAAGLRSLLEADYQIAAAVTNAVEAIEALQTCKPDIVLVDISLPGASGADVVREVKRACPTARVVMITTRTEQRYLAESLRAGTSGYILKRSGVPELKRAIQEALDGRVYVSPLLADTAAPAVDLTVRQREVLQLVAEGYTTKEAASELHISTKTVEFHKAGIMQKLGMHSTAELTKYAIESGIIQI